MAVTADFADSAPGRSGRAPQQAGDVDAWRRRIDQQLEQRLHPSPDACPQLVAAMRYSLHAPGKRVRPLLAVLTALDLDTDPARVLDFACALEMVHCASLMLDDLPCMDDARTRRGRPAAHRRFGEATTTLAAIALLNQAFGVVARAAALDAPVRAALVDDLSRAVGTAGLVSGQSLDLGGRGDGLDCQTLERIHRQKTGVLFELAVTGAGRVAAVDAARLEGLSRYARHVGLAFQAADDLLDAHRPGRETGKDFGADRGKNGSVHHVGEDAMRGRLERELAAAEEAIASLRVPGRRLPQFVRALFLPLF